MGPHSDADVVRASLAQMDATILALINLRMTIALTATQHVDMAQPTYRVRYEGQPARAADDFGVYVVLAGSSNYLRGVMPDMRISHVCDLIEHETGVPAARQRLFHGGVELARTQTLADAGVGADETIFVVDSAGTTWTKALDALNQCS